MLCAALLRNGLVVSAVGVLQSLLRPLSLRSSDENLKPLITK